MRAAVLSWVIALSAVGAPAAAAAEGVVAVLPLSAGERRMEIYGKPVADALVAGLRGGSFRVETVSGTPPEGVHLVIDGSIIAGADGTVMLEARVRDPGRGRVVASAATDYGELPRIDELAAKLAAELAVALPGALAGARRQATLESRRQGPVELPEAVVRGRADWFTAGTDDAARPRMLVYRAAGRVAYGNVDVDRPGTRAAYGLAADLGFQPLAAEAAGIVTAAAAAEELRRVDADYALMTLVRAIDFSWDGILLARGRVRVVVVDRTGQTVYDRSVRTDTLVGSRGDRHRALVHFVVRQAGQIAAADLAQAIERRTDDSASARR